MLKSSLLFKKDKRHGQITREFFGLRMQNFHGIVFIRTPTYSESFKSALAYF